MQMLSADGTRFDWRQIHASLINLLRCSERAPFYFPSPAPATAEDVAAPLSISFGT